MTFPPCLLFFGRRGNTEKQQPIKLMNLMIINIIIFILYFINFIYASGNDIIYCLDQPNFPSMIRNKTASVVRMGYLRGATQDEVAYSDSSIPTLEVDLIQLHSLYHQDTKIILGHFQGSDKLIADNIMLDTSNGMSFGYGTIQGFISIFTSIQISRLVPIGKVPHNTKFYVYSLSYYFNQFGGDRRLAIFGDLPSPYIEIADIKYNSFDYLMVFQFNYAHVNSMPKTNGVSHLPSLLFEPPAIYVPTIMGNVPIIIVKDGAYGDNALLYFVGIFNTKVFFKDMEIMLDPLKKECSVFFGSLDEKGVMNFIVRIDPPRPKYTMADVSIIKFNEVKTELYVVGTTSLMPKNAASDSSVDVFIAHYKVTPFPELQWIVTLNVTHVKQVCDLVLTEGIMLLNIQWINFENTILQISKVDGRILSNVTSLPIPHYGAKIAIDAEKRLLVVSKYGQIYSDINYHFGPNIESSISLVASKYEILLHQNDNANESIATLQPIYSEEIVEGSVSGTQPILISADVRSKRRYDIASTFSGSLSISKDPLTKIRTIGYSNGFLASIVENCNSCSDDSCKVYFCGLYSQDDTDTSDDPEVCSGHGNCVGKDICQCDYSYTGEKCDIPITQGFTSCGVGKYLNNFTYPQAETSPIELFGNPPSLFLTFDNYGQPIFVGYGISLSDSLSQNIGLVTKFTSLFNTERIYFSKDNDILDQSWSVFYITGVVSDTTNSTFVLGWASKTLGMIQQYVGVLFKLSPLGIVEFIKEFGNVIPESIYISPEDNSILIAGGYRGSVEIDICSAPSSSMVNTIVFQLTSDVQCLWMTTSQGLSKGFSISSDNLDNLILAGVYRGAIRFDDKQVVDKDSDGISYYFVKFGPLDEAGYRRVLWIRSVITNTTTDDNLKTSDQFFTSRFASFLKLDSNRNILFSGEFGSYVQFQNNTIKSNYERNTFLLKTDSNGFIQSIITFENVYNTTIDVDKNSFTYVAGVIRPGGSNIGGNSTSARLFAAKYCVRNHLKWYKELPLPTIKYLELGTISSAFDHVNNILAFATVEYPISPSSFPTITTVTFKDETCLSCPIGTYSPSSQIFSINDCIPCTAGHYNSEMGAGECTPCPRATYNEKESAISRDQCLPCKVGSSNNEFGQKDCVPCSPGKFTNSTGSYTCKDCRPGYYSSNPGQTECDKCKPGEYNEIWAQSKCTKCTSGTYQPLYAQTNSSSCIPCSEGSYNEIEGSSICTLCPKGTSNPKRGSNSVIDCVSCSAGKYSEVEGATTCELCDIGTYSLEVGATNKSSCVPCKKGSYNPNQGQSICFNCPMGYYLPKEGAVSESDCILCPIGFYSNQTGREYCDKCPDGTTTLSLGSKNISHCTYCDTGSFLGEKLACEFCPPSTYSSVKGRTSCSSCPLNLPTIGSGNSSIMACFIIPIIIVSVVISLILISIPIIIFGVIFKRQYSALKRKKKAEDEMMSKLLEHVKTSYSGGVTSSPKPNFATLIPIEELEFKERVSEGAGGVIFKAFWKGTEVAVKRIKTNQFGDGVDDESFEHEANMLTSLRHPNIVLLIGVSIDEENKYIITEFVNGVHPYSDMPIVPKGKPSNSPPLESMNSNSSGHNSGSIYETMNIFSIGNEVIHGRRPVIPWEIQPLQLQVANTEQDLKEVKTEWYLYCNKVSENEISNTTKIQDMVDRYITLMKKCWLADDTQRPEFTQILRELNEIDSLWKQAIKK
ncbi:hypothetical protein ABK040_008867 [Willaertia magna]